MTEGFREWAEWGAILIEALGVGLIVVLSLHALGLSVVRLGRREPADAIYAQLRLRLGRAILLGLELLVAADIIHTVAVDLTFRTVGVLAVVVLIRTFLSFTLEVELSGRWPWQQEGGATASEAGV